MLKISKRLYEEYKTREVWSDEEDDFVEKECLSEYYLQGHIIEGETIVGELSVRCFVGEEDSEECYEVLEAALLDRIDIYAKYRNQGFGTCAIKDLKKALNENSQNSVNLYCVSDNSKAARLYARIGTRLSASSAPDWLLGCNGKLFEL